MQDAKSVFQPSMDDEWSSLPEMRARHVRKLDKYKPSTLNHLIIPMV